LSLVPIDPDEGKKIMSGKRPININDIDGALKELTLMFGHIVSKRQLATNLSSRLGITVSGVEKALDRGLDNGMFLTHHCEAGWHRPLSADERTDENGHEKSPLTT